jgi:hypothetical protein
MKILSMVPAGLTYILILTASASAQKTPAVASNFVFPMPTTYSAGGLPVLEET